MRGRKQDTRPPIREVLQAKMDERGHNVAEAEQAMGMTPKTLNHILSGRTHSPGKSKIEQIAAYLGIPYRAACSWFHRDHQRSEAYVKREITLADVTTLTWFGVMDVPQESHDCKKCTRVAECWLAANAGLPLPCEHFLPREIVPQGAVMRERV